MEFPVRAEAFLTEAGHASSRLTTFRRRILVAQLLYAAAAICLVSTDASVVALAVVQLYFIVSPRLPGR